MYFSDCFSIKKTEEDDWFDVILDNDTKLFVDPFLIFQDSSTAWQNAHDILIKYFDICFQLIASSGMKKASPAYRKAIDLLQFPEPREFCLGYTEFGIDGSGSGPGYAVLIADAMEDAIRRGVKHLAHFEELGILNEGIGPDRISDLTCNVLRPQFIEYTQRVASKSKLPTQQVKIRHAEFSQAYRRWNPKSVSLPINPINNSSILLVPQRFLRELPTLNAGDWWNNYEAEQLRNDMNYEVMGKVGKRKIVSIARRNPSSVHAWTKEAEAISSVPYDFRSDPKGVWIWKKEGQRFAASSPITIVPPDSQTKFVDVIRLIIHQFKHFVEEQGGWKLLWNDTAGKDKNEEAAQLLFRGITSSYCSANDIVIDREVNLGRGPVDFKFSNGYHNRALLEIKKLHNGKFWQGLQTQLPSYLESDECDLGWFMIIKYREEGSSQEWEKRIPGIINTIQQQQQCIIYAVTINAAPKKSASKQ